jgi:hypothetical protein
MTRITVTLHEDQHTFVIIFRSLIFRMRNVSGKRCRKNQNTLRIVCLKLLLFENRAVYGKMLTNFVKLDRPRITI